MDRLRLTAVAAVAALAVPTAPADARDLAVAHGGAKGRIVVVDDEDGDRRIVTRSRYPSNPVWSPRRTLLAYAATTKAGFDHVRIVSRSGEDDRRMTPFGFSFPSWRPGGRLTVACGRLGACESRPGLYLLDRSRPRDMRRIARTAGASSSSWAPGGDRVVFVSPRQGPGDLFVKRIGHPRLRRLTRSGIDEAAPDWSPDGQWIVYSRSPRYPHQPHDLWLASPDGDRVKPLTRTRRNETNPSWSRTGARIVFSTPRGLFTIRPDGTGRRRVPGSRQGDCCPDW